MSMRARDCADQIDAAMDLGQSAGLKPNLNLMASDAGGEELVTRSHALLTRGER